MFVQPRLRVGAPGSGVEIAPDEAHIRLVEGCLVAGAAGDMIGGPYETWSAARMRAEQVRPVISDRSRIGDDTQLMLFTLEGVIRARVRGWSKGICWPPGVIWHAYLRWGITQGIEPPADRKELVESGWLYSHEVLYDRCRPSPRCLAAVREDVRGTVEEPPNAAVGSGAIMRIAPVGLLFDGGSVVEYAAQTAALTHGGAKAIAATSAYAALLNQLVEGVEFRSALERAVTMCRALPAAEVLRPALAKAIDLARRSPRSAAAMHQLGTGQTSLGALLHAVYATLCTDTTEQAVAVAIHQDGSSATSGALAGQVSALVHGPEKVPSAWRAQLPVTGLITEMVNDWPRIAEANWYVHDELADELWEKYPGY